MKASITFHDDQNPNFKAKLPLHFLGFPFLSAIEASNSQNLSFSFSTFFKSGPSFNLSYRPNDSFHPFNLRVKTGTSLFGSPINAPMTFTADFDLLRNSCSRFLLHFRPQFGDFTFRKSIESQSLPGQFSILRGELDSKGKSKEADAVSSGNRSDFRHILDDTISNVEVRARTTVKVMDRATVNFLWSMRFPKSMKNSIPGKEDFTAKIPFLKMPFLGLEKIEIESVAIAVRDVEEVNDDAVGEFSIIKKQMEDLMAERKLLKKNMDRLWSEIGDRKDAPVEKRGC